MTLSLTPAHNRILSEHGLTVTHMRSFSAVAIIHEQDRQYALIDCPYWNSIITDIDTFSRVIHIIASEIYQRSLI